MRLGEHTVTVYNALAGTGRTAAYLRTVVSGVRAEESSGAVATMQGRSSSDGITLFVPGSLPGYAEPESFAGAGSWTLRAGDIVVAGVCGLELPPATVQQLSSGRRIYRLTGVETFRDRRGRVHHLEAAGA